MTWTEEAVSRLVRAAAEGAGEWEFLPPLPVDTSGFFSEPQDWFCLGPCIARRLEGGDVELIELRGTDEQNAAILKAARMQATEGGGPR